MAGFGFFRTNERTYGIFLIRDSVSPMSERVDNSKPVGSKSEQNLSFIYTDNYIIHLTHCNSSRIDSLIRLINSGFGIY